MPLILPSNSISAVGYEVDNSLRFDEPSSTDLTRTPASAGNRKTWTYSGWIKTADGSDGRFLVAQTDASNLVDFTWGSNGEIYLGIYESGAWKEVITNAKHRDVSAWYHLVIAVDTTQATASDRVKLYVNGNLQTSLATSNYPSQNYDTSINNTVSHIIGRYTSGIYFNGYMAELCLIDGQALDPTSFGEFDSATGIWKPIDVSGLTFGTNGFYLDFENSGSLGADVSGNGNDFTVNNLTSIDQTTDTPTNNFATMNPLDNSVSAGTFSEGNLKIVYSGSNGSGVALTSTMALTTGKWYFEAKLTSTNDTGNRFGITDINAHSNALANRLGISTYSYGYADSDGQIYNNNSGTAYGSTFAAGDIIGVYLDLDNNKLYFSKNGTLGSSTGYSITNPTSVSNGHYFFAVGLNSGSGTSTFECNFGGTQTYSISSGVSDDNGYGNFEYSPNITGDGVAKKFYSLCTKNLAEYG